MSRWRFVFRSLTHHWRIHLAVVLGVAAATAGRERVMICDHFDRDRIAADMSFIFMIAPHRMVS